MEQDQCKQIKACCIHAQPQIPFHPIHFGTDEIPLSQSAKYLGITFDSKLNWSAHISEKKAIVNEKLRKLYWILNEKSPINVETKCLVYNSVVKPMWTYDLMVWGVASESNFAETHTCRKLGTLYHGGCLPIWAKLWHQEGPGDPSSRRTDLNSCNTI